MICYAFPLAHEAELILKHCTEKERFSIGGLHCTLANFGKRRVLVALIGMGEAAAAENTETIFRVFPAQGFRPGRLRRRAGPAAEGGPGGGLDQFQLRGGAGISAHAFRF